MYRLVVSVINYRTPDLTLNCMRSVAEQLVAGKDLLVIVDNFSNDGSGDMIRQAISNENIGDKVVFIQSAANGGFSAGNNIVLTQYKAENFILLNSDAVLHPNCIERLLSVAYIDRQMLVSPIITDESGDAQRSQFNYRNFGSEFLSAAGTGIITRLFNKLGIYEVAQADRDSKRSDGWVSFACVLLSDLIIEKVGLLDDGFFMYAEDEDYCRRAKDEGIGICVVDSAKVVHLNKGASAIKYKRMPNYFYRSRNRYYVKHFGFAAPVLANLCWCCGYIIRLSRYLIGAGQPYKYNNAFGDIWLGTFCKK